MSEELALLPGYLTAHLQLSLAALLIGSLVSIPLGILVARRPRLEPGVLGAASLIQTIPSLALLAIAVPLLSMIGFLPALIALSLYSLLPILRNTVTGLTGVDPAVLEAARAVGMTRRQRLRRVELPLALPVIVAGLRTAAVWVVGTATLSTPVGATSLGNFIFSGLATRNDAAVLVGCVAAAGLALLLDGLIRSLERGVRQGSRARLALALAGLAILYAWCAAAWIHDRHAGSAGAAIVRIGSKPFTEQYVLAELLALRVAAAGGDPELRPSLGSTVAFDALRRDELDLYVEYSGTIWATLMHRGELPARRGDVLADVREFLAREHGVRVVCTLGFENTYALAMRGEAAHRQGVVRISQLAPLAPRLALGSDYEFLQRAEWHALRDRYGLRFREERSMDPALMLRALVSGQVDVVSVYSTEGRIEAERLAVLEDDLGVIPPYDAILLASPRLARERPDLVRSLSRLEGLIDAPAMRRMNLAVDGHGRTPAEVAREFEGSFR